MTPTIETDQYTLYLADCLDALKAMPDGSVDSIVTDPPYGLAFMGKKWDYDVPSIEIWREALRVLKEGGHLLSFGGTRTYHRMVVNIEDAGFEIRDQLQWLYGTGFPKSLDVSKAIDKAAGAEREVLYRGDGRELLDGYARNSTGAGEGVGEALRPSTRMVDITAPATPEASQWDGWGTALKPANEPIVLARKPFKGTVAANVLKHGTGALNIDGCRVGEGGGTTRSEQAPYAESGWRTGHKVNEIAKGRWPANVIHDGSEEVLAGFGDQGSAARFFYCAKPSKAERNKGLDSNTHPTVKPVALMRYLCRLITPPEGIVLDPFLGSGTTGVAALLERFRFVGIEREPEYMEIAKARIAKHAASQRRIF